MTPRRRRGSGASGGRRSQTVGLGRSGVCTECCSGVSACLVRVSGVVSRNTLYTRNGDGCPEWNWPPVPERNRGPDTGM